MTINSTYDYYHLPPEFYGRVDTSSDIQEIFNFNTQSWVKAESTLFRRIQQDGEQITQEKVIAAVKKQFSKL